LTAAQVAAAARTLLLLRPTFDLRLTSSCQEQQTWREGCSS